MSRVRRCDVSEPRLDPGEVGAAAFALRHAIVGVEAKEGLVVGAEADAAFVLSQGLQYAKAGLREPRLEVEGRETKPPRRFSAPPQVADVDAVVSAGVEGERFKSGDGFGRQRLMLVIIVAV